MLYILLLCSPLIKSNRFYFPQVHILMYSIIVLYQRKAYEHFLSTDSITQKGTRIYFLNRTNALLLFSHTHYVSQMCVFAFDEKITILVG